MTLKSSNVPQITIIGIDEHGAGVCNTRNTPVYLNHGRAPSLMTNYNAAPITVFYKPGFRDGQCF